MIKGNYLLLACGIGLGALVLAGCAGSSVAATGPGVRAINGLTSAGQANLMDGTIVLGSAIPYATVTGFPHTPYAIVPDGVQSITIANSTTPTTILATTSLNIVNAGQHFDEIAYNPTAPTFLTLIDNFSIPSTSNIRFVNASTVTGNIDVILTPPSTFGASVKYTLAPGTTGPVQPTGTFAYQSYPGAGAFTVQVFPAGQDSGTALISETINLPQGANFTYILLDPPASGQGPVLLEVQDNQLYDSAP